MGSFDNARGRWDKVDTSSGYASSESDQIIAEALDLIRTSQTFVVIAISDSVESEVISRVTSLVYDDDANMLAQSVARFLIRLWFQDVSANPDSRAIEAIRLADAFAATLERFLEHGNDLEREEDA